MTTKFAVAKALAEHAHDGQVDKAGESYLGHVLRVAGAVGSMGEDFAIVGILHDVLEDAPDKVGVDVIGDLFGRDVLVAVYLLTRQGGVSYKDYIERINAYEGRAGVLAREVKKADLLDNLSAGRAASLEPSLRKRYLKALRRLALG
jgi:(p)ppGpp synthase/HD superfamily hydrolase